MNLNKIPSGKKPPDDIYVIIEISANADPIKYEVNKKYGVLFVDRFISTTMFYPCNYGYINKTLSLDGDPIDVLVPTPYPLQPGSVINCRPIGALDMTDESGEDIKLIAVPNYKIIKEYDNINDIIDLQKSLQEQLIHFFMHYKELEKGKWVKINGWRKVDYAKQEITSSIKRFKK
ncbi:Inorganic pyrophosphatase [Candidatus Providencia siddallii]|uniref:Inorganic pyrophosphatase n=1 Tax=Candidatus Providencia siddallii TaxID=1715285 RepID=A0A0M6W738_9GAMM|nr:Inorganic pyrophosphatase [Candidatus Providencia siddallii]